MNRPTNSSIQMIKKKSPFKILLNDIIYPFQTILNLFHTEVEKSRKIWRSERCRKNLFIDHADYLFETILN